jgi:hypothetical protein
MHFRALGTGVRTGEPNLRFSEWKRTAAVSSTEMLIAEC